MEYAKDQVALRQILASIGRIGSRTTNSIHSRHVGSAPDTDRDSDMPAGREVPTADNGLRHYLSCVEIDVNFAPVLQDAALKDGAEDRSTPETLTTASHAAS